MEELAKLLGFEVSEMLTYGLGIYLVVETLKNDFSKIFYQPWVKRLLALVMGLGMGVYLFPGNWFSTITFGLLSYATAAGANRAISKSGGKVGNGSK